jgi:regulator of protease activity HflC (stomatin/prohibitin superfamily)
MYISTVIFITLAILLIGTIAIGITVIEQQTVGLVERFGKFNRTLQPGLNFIIPFIETIGRQNMRVVQLNVPVETKTKDNVFVRTTISVQFSVMPTKVYESFYKLSNVQQQISSYVFDSVRSIVPKMTLDEFFDKKDEIADNIKSELLSTMTDFGYQIDRALVTDIEPDAAVKTSMNLINAAERQKLANEQAGEAEKILIVKRAEADAEAKRQQGLGIANQRKEILKGFQEAITDFKNEHGEVSTDEVMKLMLLTQHMDMLKTIGAENSVILIPHNPGSMGTISEEIITALQINKATK